MNNSNSDLKVLQNAVLFSLTRRAWSNRKQVNRSQILIRGTDGAANTAASNRTNTTKDLLVSPELEAINKHLNVAYTWSLQRSMSPRSKDASDEGGNGALRKGIYFVRRTVLGEFEAFLKAANDKLTGELIPRFLASYDERREAMRRPDKEGGLGDLFDARDYPKADALRSAFGIQWTWLALGVPDDLPDVIRQRENEKLRASFLEAQEEITLALRGGFRELIAHATERLTSAPGEKPKIFRDSLVENFNEFFATFNARNMMEDADLERLVTQARQVISGLGSDAKNAAETLRNSPDTRQATIAQFATLNATLDAMTIEKPSRKFDWSA